MSEQPELEDPVDPEPAAAPDGETDAPAPAPDEGQADLEPDEAPDPGPAPEGDETSPAPVDPDPAEEAPPAEPDPEPPGEAPPADADPAPVEEAPAAEPAPPEEVPAEPADQPDAAPDEPVPEETSEEGPPETVVSVDEDLAGEQPPAPQGPPPEELEASLNELAETLTHLSKSIEEIKAFRDEMEARLNDVEERMVRLGSLAEAVSMQYNPFLEEDGADPTRATDRHRRSDDREAATTRPDPAEPRDGPDDAEPGEANPSNREPVATRSSASEDPLERRMLVMEWVKFLIERVGRVRLLDLLEYYEELGWLDPHEKDKIMKVAVGVDGPDRVEDADWKGDRELHERSLIALERLRGRDVTSQTIDSLHLDLDRLFGG